MLEWASAVEIWQLRNRVDFPVGYPVDVGALDIGIVIKVVTQSGNVYLFEIIDPVQSLAHVVRCEFRPRAPNSGYLGRRVISKIIRIGDQVIHKGSVTSSVQQIYLLRI